MFAGKTVTEHFFPETPNEDGSERSHGTAVAGIMVGRPSDTFTARFEGARGVAWGADIAMFALRAGSAGDKYNPTGAGALGSARRSVERALRDRARLVEREAAPSTS